MSALLHPVGPEPERTYWVRRVIAVAVVLVALSLLIWLVSRAFGSAPQAATPASPTSTSVSGGSSSAPTTTGSAAPTATTSSAGSTSSSATASRSPARPAPASSAPASSAPASSASSTTSASASTKPSTSTPTPIGAVNCDPRELTLTITGDADRRVTSGSKTTLYLALANPAATACLLDLGRNPLTLEVTSGTDEIWSTTDCAAWAPRGAVAVPAKGSWTRPQSWTTQRSASGCTLSEEYLRPGTYVATASLSGGQTRRFVFQLVG